VRAMSSLALIQGVVSEEGGDAMACALLDLSLATDRRVDSSPSGACLWGTCHASNLWRIKHSTLLIPLLICKAIPKMTSVQALRRIAVVAALAACLGASAVVDVVIAWTNVRSSFLLPIAKVDRKGLQDAQRSPDGSPTEKAGSDVPSDYTGMPTPFHAASMGEVFARAPR
jgi:hypothetical protein